jgi:hypothetical protein
MPWAAASTSDSYAMRSQSAGSTEDFLDHPEDREERIERGVAVELSRILDGKGPAGLSGQLQHGLRTYAALDVTVQLDLRDLVVQVCHGCFVAHGGAPQRLGVDARTAPV